MNVCMRGGPVIQEERPDPEGNVWTMMSSLGLSKAVQWIGFFLFFLSTCNNESYVHFFLFAIFKKTHFYKSSLMVEPLASAGGSDISQQTGSFLFQSADD